MESFLTDDERYRDISTLQLTWAGQSACNN